MEEPQKTEEVHPLASYYFSWNNVLIKSQQEDIILDNVNGRAQTGRVLAILGASGSGKTTLLNYLSGYSDGKLISTGELSLAGTNNLKPTNTRNVSGYVL